MKSKVILFCVLLFCSKIVDSIPHSESHVRQRVNPLSNWQVNKKVPNAQYLDTDFTQPRNVNKLTNSAIQQENNEDYYSNQRGYNYDGYGYNKGPASSSSTEELLVNYDSPADGRRLDSYPPRVESYPSQTSQDEFDHQQYRDQKRSQNPFPNSVPSSVFIPNDERPLVTSVQEPYRGLGQYVKPKYVPSLNRPFYQPGRSYLTKEQLQYPSVDHSGVNKYVVNPATRFGSRGLVPNENYSESQASETKTRPTGVRRYVQNFETPSEINYETPAVESPDTLVDQSENIRYSVPYENYREGQVSETKSRPTGVRRHVQNFETPTEINYETPSVESPDTLVDQSANIRYPVPYENYRVGQVSDTKTRLTGVRRHVQNFETPSEVNYETPAVESSDTLVDQSENIRYPVPYENYREGQVSKTRIRPPGIHRHVHNFETLSEVNYETPAVGSSDTLVDQSENIRYLVPYENYRESQVSETKTRLNGVRKHVQNSEINYETPAVESPVTLVDRSEKIRYPVPYENYREGQVSETKTRLSGVRRHVQDFETPSEINYETPAVESPHSLAGQSENIRYVENSRSGSHLSNSAPITSHDDGTPVISETDDYSSDSIPSNLAPVVNVKKETTVEISKVLADKPLARKYAHRSDYEWSNIARDNSNNDAPTDITETVEVKEEKYGTNYAEEKAVPINTYPEDSITPTNTVLENSGSHTYEESNVPQYESSSPNNSKENAIHHLTSEIKELSLKSLVANPEIQHILSRTDKRYVVVHSNGTIEYLDTLPLDSQQDSKLHLVHTKRKNIDGSEGDGVLTPQWLQNSPSNIAKTLAPVDEYQWPTNNQAADEYDSNRVIEPLLPHAEQPTNNDNSKPLLPPVNQSDHGGYSKPLAPNEAQPVYDANPRPTPENLLGDDDNSNPLPRDVNHPTDDDIFKHWTSPENQPRDEDSSKPLHTDANQRKNKINLTPYARNPVHVKRHKHAYVTLPANDNTFKPLLPNEAQQRDDINSEPAHPTQPAQNTKPKHSQGNQPENGGNSNPSSPNKNQPADDFNSEPLNENLSGDDIVSKLWHPYYRHHKKSKHSHVNEPADGNNSNPSTTPEPLYFSENQPRDDNPANPLSSNKNQSGDNKKSIPSDTNENQTGTDNDSEPLTSHKSHPTHHHKSKQFYGNQQIEDDNSNSALENQPGDYNAAEPLPSNEDDKQSEDDASDKPKKLNENQSEGDIDSELLSPHKKPRAHHNKAKPKHSHVNLESDNDSSNPSSQHENQPGDENAAEPLRSNNDDKQPEDDKSDKPQKINENQSEGDIDSETLLPHKKPRAHHNKAKPKHPHVNLESDDDNSNPSSQHVNQPGDETDSTPSPPHKKPRAHHKRPKHSDMNQPAYDDNSKPSSLNQPGEDNNPNSPKTSYGNEADDNNSKQPLSDENQPAGDKTPKQSAGETESKPSPHKKQRAHRNKSQSKHSRGNQPANASTSKPLTSNENDISPDKKSENDDSSKSSLSPENRLADDNDYTSLPLNKGRNKSKHSNVNKPGNDNNSNPASPEKNQLAKNNGPKPLPSNADQSGDETDSKPSLSHKKQSAHSKKPKHSHVYLELDDNNANPSSQDENQQRDDKVDENQSEDETVTTSLSPHKKQRVHHKKPKHSDVYKSVDDNNSKTSPDETQTEDDKKSKSLPTSESQSTKDNNSKPSPPEENQPEDDIKSKPTTVLSKNDEESRSTTLSPTVPSHTTTRKPQAIKKYKRKHSHRKTKTNSPVVSTTPSPDDSSEDQIITLSPIKQVTDNVSEIPSLISTTAKPVETPDKQDTYKDANNKPDESHDDTKSSFEDKASISDKVKTSTTTATPSSSNSPTDNASDDKTKGKSEENENKAVVSKENNGKDNTQTAVYNSSELLDTNTDVPEESDDYSPVAPSPSVQNDVDTVDASGDNSSELEQSETDLTITVSSSTTYDSEAEIITINIEVSESTDDADSPSNDKTLVVSIDTNPDDDDETDVSNTTKTEDCQDDHNHDDGRSNNAEIDLSNLKGEPTMWIKTTNQDFIDQLTAKNDTLFDVVYFFSVENQPTIEREKETTIFCNGTVVIENTEITYAHKDDPTPTIVKTTEIMQIEDYELKK